MTLDEHKKHLEESIKEGKDNNLKSVYMKRALEIYIKTYQLPWKVEIIDEDVKINYA